MKLNEQVFWSSNDLITQTLGTYEDHVVKLINFNKKGFKRFIDIGRQMVILHALLYQIYIKT